MKSAAKTAATLAAAATLVLAGSSAASAQSAQSTDEPRPVSSVDAARYAGTWYQVAAVPQLFEIQCKKNVRADYAVTPAGTLSVRNSCATWLGGTSTINGEAKPLDDSGARLNVSFLKLGDTYYHGDDANYIVVGLGEDYDWAVVTGSDRDSGFVLSRTPSIDAGDLGKARAAIVTAGLDACDFRTTRQDGGATTSVSLCRGH